MKQKITISLTVNIDKCRTKAMKIAVSTPGVISVTSDADKNQLVVTGDGVDSFVLMKCLKKKFKCASILSIEEAKPEKKDDKKEEKKDEKKEDEKNKKDECCKICRCSCPCPPLGYNNPCVQYYPVCQPVYDSNPSCSIQ